MCSLIFLTAVLLSSSAAAAAAHEVNLLYCYWCRGDGANNSACLSILKAQQARASSFASCGAPGAENPQQRASDNASIVCPFYFYKDDVTVYYDDHHMLLFSGGDIHQNLNTNRPAPWVAWNMNFVTGAAGRNHGRKARMLSNLIVDVAADTPGFMHVGFRSSCLTDDDEMFSPVPKCWFSNQSGDDHRVGGRILVLTCKILSTVNITLLITFAGLVLFVLCLILTGGNIQGIRDGRVQRELSDWQTQVTGNIDPGFSLCHFPTIRDTIGDFSKQGRGSFGLVYRPLVPVVVMALLLSSAAGASVGCYDRENMTRRVKPLYYDCGCPNIVSPTVQEQDRYYDNRTSLAGKLVRALSASPSSIFANYTVGSVSGFVVCRGDYSGSACAGNLEQTINDYINITDINANQIICQSSTDITIYYDQHMLSFAGDGYTYKDPGSNRPAWVASNMNYVNSSTGFAGLYGERVRELLNHTASYAALNSSGLYATGMSWFDDEAGVGIIYGLVQCRPDMSRDLCRQCLDNLTAEVPGQFTTGSGDHCVGGRILGVWCNVRFEKELFFKETFETQQLHRPKDLNLATMMDGNTLFQLPFSIPPRHLRKIETISISIAAILSIIILVSLLGWVIQWRKDSKTRNQLAEWTGLITAEIGTMFTHFSLSEVRNATDNFSEAKKLGQGAFGPVYQGQLACGVVAIKRLGAYSSQGLEQFRNEIRFIAKLQHLNLVKLIGCCMQKKERILIYEYMPNKSLDDIFKDVAKWASLTWPLRQNIIDGIAQGLLYIHNFAQLETCIVHRDLKASNILLDHQMNPKISDFGIAMLSSSVTESQNTVPMGTPGYMAPECFLGNNITVKSDVFSFGVLILEIISGRKVATSFRRYRRSDNLMAYAWRLWEDGNCKQLIDSSLSVEEHNRESEIIRCIQIGLLCVQANPEDRPDMVEVVRMLSNNETQLDNPRQPAYFNEPIIATTTNHASTLYVTAIQVHPA